jgi:uncharacterized damage-inducible protein DinB
MASRFADMFVDLADDPRTDPPGQVDERATLLGFLRWQRQTLELKCAGLDAAALARRSLDPSKLSLLGLVRHLTDVERGWIRRGLAGEGGRPLYATAGAPDTDFDGAAADPELVDQAWEAWRAEAAYTDRFVTTADLDITLDDEWRGPLSLRWVLVHLVEEYARHLGHADILRERIDGRVGQ